MFSILSSLAPRISFIQMTRRKMFNYLVKIDSLISRIGASKQDVI